MNIDKTLLKEWLYDLDDINITMINKENDIKKVNNHIVNILFYLNIFMK